jgi:serine/threonine protein kinase
MHAEGSYGVVYKCMDMVTDRLVALKRIKLEMEHNDSMPTTALREITLLRTLCHPNIVKLEHVILQPKGLYLVFEFVELDLKKFLDNSAQYVTGDLLKSYTTQLFEGLAYCHATGTMHRCVCVHTYLCMYIFTCIHLCACMHNGQMERSAFTAKCIHLHLPICRI